MREADIAKTRARGGRIRHDRYNVRGHVWCNHCQKYLPPENFKRHPSRPHTLWSYCKECTRIKDRERYAKRTSTLEGAIADLDRRMDRKRRLTARRHKERREFVSQSIDLLRRRGFTKAEITRLVDTTFGELLKWERHEVLPAPAVANRLEIIVRASSHLPVGEPVSRRRLPHPEFAHIHAETIDEVRLHHVRNAWTNGRRSAAIKERSK